MINGLELYVIGVFEDGELKRFVRKSRNFNIVGYDNLTSAKRGLAHSRAYNKHADFRILKAVDLSEVSI